MFFIGNKKYELSVLNAYSKALIDTYQVKRKQMDEARTFGFFLPYTHNQSRLDNIKFLETVASFVIQNKFIYSSWDESFRSKRYDREVAPFLRKVVLGIYLFELKNITDTYYSEAWVKTSSALGSILLDFFEIDKLSDIPKEVQAGLLLSLQKYIQSCPKEHTSSFPEYVTKIN
jgi:hypothetical protein